MNLANEARWLTKARIVAKAVARSQHPGMSDIEFEKTWSISTEDWKWRYLQGTVRGFGLAELTNEHQSPDRTPSNENADLDRLPA